MPCWAVPRHRDASCSRIFARIPADFWVKIPKFPFFFPPPALLAGASLEEDEDLNNLWATASTFIVLFILSLFYSTTVTLIKVK